MQSSETGRGQLETAREAFLNKDYPQALKHYLYFFDHALTEDPDLYEIRLSYGLGEWAELARVYAPAKAQLHKRRDEALRGFERSRNPELFHDFFAICTHLRDVHRGIKQFLRYHKTDRELAGSIVSFVWQALLDQELWGICGDYMNAEREYAQALEDFDELMVLCEVKDTLGDEFRQSCQRWYQDAVQQIMKVLNYNNRQAEAVQILACVRQDMAARGLPELAERICARYGEEGRPLPGDR